jgi:hypothetical protein
MTTPHIPNHLKYILDAIVQGAIPTAAGVHVVEMLHDNDCSLLHKKGYCDCKPDVHLKWSKPSIARN